MLPETLTIVLALPIAVSTAELITISFALPFSNDVKLYTLAGPAVLTQFQETTFASTLISFLSISLLPFRSKSMPSPAVIFTTDTVMLSVFGV